MTFKHPGPVRITVLLLLLIKQAFAQPVITSFSPLSGAPGTTVTIGGTGFGSTPAANKVYFGGAIAPVLAASGSSLTVTVPPGAGYACVSATVNNLTGYSPQPFTATFAGNGATLSAASFAGALQVVTGPGDPSPSPPVGADVDGDGKLDIVTGNGNRNVISILRNAGVNGSLAFNTVSIPAYSFWTYNLAMADIDGDGRLDIAAVSYGNILSVFANTSVPGTVSFGTRLDLATNATPFGIAVGDIDGDGRPDIVLANNGANNLSVYRNTSSPGNISFAGKTDVATGSKPYGIAVGDVNADGKPDIVVTNNVSNVVSVYQNTSTAGAISVAAKVDYATGNYPVDVVIGDLNADGKPDLAVANYFGGSISVFKNTGTGTAVSFAAKTDITTYSDPQSMGIGDLNGDGLPDIVLANYNGTASVVQNNSAGGSLAFGWPLSFSTSTPADGIAINDFDGDGKPELAIGANASGAAINVFRNKVNEPVISSIAPVSAGAGETVTITGSNFTGATAVSLGGVPASSFTVVNASTITAEVPNAALSDRVTVTNPSGTGVYNGFQYKGPSLFTYSPLQGGQGTAVTLNGRNFTGTTAVSFGSTPAASFTVNSPSKITATVGPGASGPVVVTTPFGFIQADTLFTYYLQPTISSFAPAIGINGTTVSIKGSAFNSTSAVRFGGVSAVSFVVTSDSTLEAVVGTGASGDVSITTTGGTGTKSGFVFAGPTVQTFSPAAAHAADTVVITGTNFTATTNVRFGNTPASSFIVSDDTTIRAVVGNGASGTVSVTTPNGTASKAGFVYTGPVIHSFTPVVTGFNKPVIISGQNFTGVTRVTFGGTDALSFQVDSGTIITAVLDTGSTGNVVVTTPNGTATRAGFTFAPQPQIFSVTPNAAGYGMPVVIRGKNFIQVTAITIGGQAALSYAVSGDTLVNAVTGAASSGAVSLQASGGVAVYNGFVFLPAPNVQSFSPSAAGKGFTVTIRGTNFTTATDLRFGSTQAFSFQVVADTVITAVVAGGSSGSVTVVAPGGSGSKAGFTYVPPPVVSSFTPATASVATTVTISGHHFTNASGVTFGGTPAVSFGVTNDSTITAVVGTGSTGFVKVATPYGSDSLAGYKHNSVPVVSSFAPASGPVGTVVTITGNAFNPVPAANTVYFGATQATVTAASANALTVIVPAGATSQPLTVTANGLTAYSAKPFAITFPDGGTPLSVYAFGPKTNAAIAQYPTGLTLADLNKDGKADVVAASGYNNIYAGISVVRNVSANNQPLLAAKADYSGNPSTNVVMADFDGDGWPDIASGNGTDVNAVNVFRNNGAGVFTTSQTITYGGLGGFYLAVGDVDGDGKPDLVILSSYSYRVVVMRNTTVNGTISFVETSVVNMGNYSQGIAVADVDGDGKPDIVAGNYSTGMVSVMRNLSTPGNVALAAKLDFATGSVVLNLSVGDIDGDGKTDIAIMSGSAVSVLRNTSVSGTVSFAARTSFPYGSYGYVIAVSDIDGDGKPDLLVPNGAKLSVLRNTSITGTVSFDAKVDFTGFNDAYGVAVGDMDGDSKPDLTVSNNANATVSVLRNQIGEPSAVKLCPPAANTTLTTTLAGAAYRWQVNTGTGFTDIVNNSNYTGSSTASLQLAGIPSSWNGYLYRCLVDGVAANTFKIGFANVWTGTASTAWENPANWTCGAVPDANTSVVITSGTVVLSSNVTLYSLVLVPGVTLTVTPGFTLTVTH